MPLHIPSITRETSKGPKASPSLTPVGMGVNNVCWRICFLDFEAYAFPNINLKSHGGRDHLRNIEFATNQQPDRGFLNHFFSSKFRASKRFVDMRILCTSLNLTEGLHFRSGIFDILSCSNFIRKSFNASASGPCNNPSRRPQPLLFKSLQTSLLAFPQEPQIN